MASYQEGVGGDVMLGRFLPGLTRVLTSPVRITAKVAKDFVRSPIKGLKTLALAPVSYAKDVKFAVAGSKPIFKKKPKKVAARKPALTASASPAASQPITSAYVSSLATPPPASLPSPVPTVTTMPEQAEATVENITANAEAGVAAATGKKPFPIILVVGAAAVAGFFLLKKRGA